MGTALTSTTGLIPMLLSLIGVMAALRYIKGMSDYTTAIRFVFWGFGLVFLAKLLRVGAASLSGYYYCFLLFLHLCSAVFFITAGVGLKNPKAVNLTLVVSACLLAGVWSWYAVVVTRDANSLRLSLAVATIGYGGLALSLWRRKTLRNSIGFVITGWLFIFLMLYNLLALMSWGQSLLSPSFETFLYIAVMCGWFLISNNMMAHQFDALEQEANESKERLRLMIQMSPFPIIISRLKDDQLMLINNKAGALFGLDVKHPGNFKTVDYFADPSKRTELLAKLEKHPVVDDFEFLVKPRKGEPFWLLLSARVIDFEYEIALYMAFQDITDRKKKEIQLFDQATKDPLTKCYNRRQFEELAKNEIQRSRRYKHPFCLFMIDADHFKNVNDTHGHAVGDLVLMALADCCRRTLRESDIVSRFGGEEFVILLPEVSLENAVRVTERLRIMISKLVVKNEQNQDVRFTVSIGLVSSTVTDDIPEMLKMADESLYVAKENGRNQVVVYEESGPNKDYPKPAGEDIEKALNEPLFYFKPSSAPAVNTYKVEPSGTGVVGLSADAADHDEEPLLDDEEEVTPPASSGISLNSLYDDDGEDDGFIASSKPPVAPPVPLTSPYEEPEMTPEEEAEPPLEDEEPYIAPEPEAELPLEEDELPTETYEAPAVDEQEPALESEIEPELEPEIEPEAEPELPAEQEEEFIPAPQEEELPPEDDIVAEEPAAEDAFVPELPEEPEIELPTVEVPEPAFEPPADDIIPLSVDEEFPAPPMPVMSPMAEDIPEPPAPVVTMKVPKAPVMKKLPIKMPPGMVKIPKMPGVVRVKIPKALHQAAPASVGVKPPEPEE